MNIQDLEKSYREGFFSVRDLSLHDVELRAGKLMNSAKDLNLPSLVFAANQLLHIKKHGVSSINVGGTMGGGKSSVGEALSKELSWEFVDADEFHPESNIEKQRKGEALTTEDRIPFLKAVRDFLAGRRNRVSTCSALKSEYRAVLAGQDPERIGDGWNIAEPNYGLLQVLVYKPYSVTLEQLDRQSKGVVPKRLFKGREHFINVTKESEASAQKAGGIGILAAQFRDLETPRPYAWEALVLQVEDYIRPSGAYDLEKMISPVVQFAGCNKNCV